MIGDLTLYSTARLCDCIMAPRLVTHLQSNGAEVYEQSTAELNSAECKLCGKKGKLVEYFVT